MEKSLSCCMCEAMETYTAKVGTGAQDAHRAVPDVGGLRAWSTDMTILPPGSTSHTQPCDICYMRALKAGLTQAAASHLVTSFIMNPDAAFILQHSSMELKRMFPDLLHTTLAEISTRKDTTTQPGNTSCRAPTSGTACSLHTGDTLLQKCCMLARQNTMWTWVHA